MTDKEFKRLNRAQLIDIIYQLQIKQEKLTAENERLAQELIDKRIRVDSAGNIAQAALEMYNVMQSAQEAAERYLEEIRVMRDETEVQCKRLLEKAQQDADAIVARAKKTRSSYESAVEAIMKEYAQNNRSTGEDR